MPTVIRSANPELLTEEKLPHKRRKRTQSEKKVARAMSEVHRNEPSTVTRAKKFGPGGKEAMLKAIALEKARQATVKIPKRRKKK